MAWRTAECKAPAALAEKKNAPHPAADAGLCMPERQSALTAAAQQAKRREAREGHCAWLRHAIGANHGDDAWVSNGGAKIAKHRRSP